MISSDRIFHDGLASLDGRAKEIAAMLNYANDYGVRLIIAREIASLEARVTSLEAKQTSDNSTDSPTA